MVELILLLESIGRMTLSIRESFLEHEICDRQALAQTKRIKRKIKKQIEQYTEDDAALVKLYQSLLEIEILEHSLRNYKIAY